MAEFEVSSDSPYAFDRNCTLFTFRHYVPNELIAIGDEVVYRYLTEEFAQGLIDSLLRRSE